ncbi:dephospho-CoA kinase [Aminiphilus circumscriptus]|jgi:dephospho-CoA kinase|uniref:dephospho-CoA kinase n=1 Tax=Aminiphilus circumscriptus TaxID=290732 RepID=UPI00049269CE|nr:dephospho-CoA kinase [Aminiphilus circumscriptus]
MVVVGLTGDVGAGKSTLAHLWSGMGATVVSADAIVARLWNSPDILDAVRKRLGPDVFDEEGRARRAAVAERVFADDETYRWLNDLFHPPVLEEMERLVSAASRWVVAEIPLLFEVGVPWWMDLVVFVTAPEEIRAARNEYRGIGREALLLRERRLFSSEEKKARSRFVLENGADLETFRRKGRALGLLLRAMAELLSVECPCASREEALSLARMLVRENLAACTHIVPVESVFRWKSVVETEAEHLLVATTTERLFPVLRERLLAAHSYELPVITAREVRRGNAAALEWIVRSCVAPTEPS